MPRKECQYSSTLDPPLHNSTKNSYLRQLFEISTIGVFIILPIVHTLNIFVVTKIVQVTHQARKHQLRTANFIWLCLGKSCRVLKARANDDLFFFTANLGKNQRFGSFNFEADPDPINKLVGILFFLSLK